MGKFKFFSIVPSVFFCVVSPALATDGGGPVWNINPNGPVDSIKNLQGSPTNQAVNGLIDAGVAVAQKGLKERRSITGTCQIIEDKDDRFPRPCSMIIFSLNPTGPGQGQIRSFQTTTDGIFSAGALTSDMYELRVTSPGYRLILSERVVVERGQNIQITITRVQPKK